MPVLAGLKLQQIIMCGNLSFLKNNSEISQLAQVTCLALSHENLDECYSSSKNKAKNGKKRKNVFVLFRKKISIIVISSGIITFPNLTEVANRAFFCSPSLRLELRRKSESPSDAGLAYLTHFSFRGKTSSDRILHHRCPEGPANLKKSIFLNPISKSSNTLNFFFSYHDVSAPLKHCLSREGYLFVEETCLILLIPF